MSRQIAQRQAKIEKDRVDMMFIKINYRSIQIFVVLTLFLQSLLLDAKAQSSDEANRSSSNKEKIRVGVILGLTGPMAPVAEEMRRGMELAISEPETFPMELFYEDDKGMELKEAVSAAQRLVNEKKVTAFLSWVNTTMPAIAPIANRSKVPVLEFWDSNLGMLKMGPYVFCSGASTELAGELMAGFVVSNRRRTKIGAIVMNDPWSELVAENFTKKAEALGAKIIRKEQVNIEANDLKSVILRMKQEGADALYAPLCVTSMYTTIKQARASGFEGEIFAADCFLESDIGVVGEAAEGVYAAQVLVEDPEFIKRYAAKYEKNVSSTTLGYAGLAYDAIKIFSTTFDSIARRGEKITSENVKEEMSKLHFNGVSGPANLSGASEKQEHIVQVKDGRFVRVE